MNKEYDNYINKIVSNIGLTGKKARNIREDLYSSLIEKQQITGESNPYILMGDPYEVAEEFKENMNLNIIEQYGYEYKSEIRILGIPLIHINYKKMGVSKGIISIGNVAIGVIAIGGVSVGLISFGGIALGLLMALGGVGLAGVLSMGGLAAAGVMSFGGLAISKFLAFGGYANANIAIGGVAKGVISIFRQSGVGSYLFDSSSNTKEIMETIRMVYPNISEVIANVLEKIISLFLLP